MTALAESRAVGQGRKPLAAASAVGRRLGTAAIVLWGAITVTFVVLKSMPGDAVEAVIGGSTAITPELRQQITERYGLDQPVLVQYLNYLLGVVRGDLGTSYALRKPVAEAILDQLGSTMTLLVSATIFALVLSIVVSLATAHRSRFTKSTFQSIETVGIAVPSFWLGIMLITIFSFGLHLFPSTGSASFSSLILPTLALGLPVAATLSQVMRDALERTLDEPFVVSVRARGASEIGVRLGHALRHSLIPVVTLVGWLSGTLIGGAVIVEQVFSRPGIGRMVVAALNSRDMPVVLGVVIIAAMFYVVVNTIIDLLYPIIDPRLRA